MLLTLLGDADLTPEELERLRQAIAEAPAEAADAAPKTEEQGGV